MTESTKAKTHSPLVKSILTLDGHFANLEQLGEKIHELDVRSDFEFEQLEKLINRFTECGQAVSDEVINLSARLTEARTRAETAAEKVAERAELLRGRKTEQQKKMDAFRSLGEKVQGLTFSLSEFEKPEGGILTAEDRAKLTARLAEFEQQIQPLISEAMTLKNEGHALKMKILEQGADSLGQSLKAVSQRLSSFQQLQ